MRFVRGSMWALRRWRLRLRTSLSARLKGARVQLLMAADVRIGSRVRFAVDPGSRNRVELAEGVHLHDDVLVHLRGGEVVLGPHASVRRGSVLNVSGRLVLHGRNIVSYYNVIHCAEEIVMDELASTNEFCTIVDSRHVHDGESDFFYENVETAPIHIGRNVWLANKSSVLMGVTIGEGSIVAAHAVVHSDVPAGSVVGGIPARVIREA